MNIFFAEAAGVIVIRLPRGPAGIEASAACSAAAQPQL